MTKQILSALLVLLLLSGCVNVHVHFPPAPDAPVADDKKPQ